MKKVFLLAALLAATLCATAQQNQVIWHNGKQRNNVKTRAKKPLFVNGVDVNKYYNEMHD